MCVRPEAMEWLHIELKWRGESDAIMKNCDDENRVNIEN